MTNTGPRCASSSIFPATPVAIFVGSGFERQGLPEVSCCSGKDHGLVVRTRPSPRYRLALGIAQRVTFTGGVGRSSTMRPAMSTLMPTLYEPFGLVFGEAMACGLPITRQAGAADWSSMERMLLSIIRRYRRKDPTVQAAVADPTMGYEREAVLPYTKEERGAATCIGACWPDQPTVKSIPARMGTVK